MHNQLFDSRRSLGVRHWVNVSWVPIRTDLGRLSSRIIHVLGRLSSRIIHVLGRLSSRITHVLGRLSSRIIHVLGRLSSRIIHVLGRLASCMTHVPLLHSRLPSYNCSITCSCIVLVNNFFNLCETKETK